MIFIVYLIIFDALVMQYYLYYFIKLSINNIVELRYSLEHNIMILIKDVKIKYNYNNNSGLILYNTFLININYFRHITFNTD